MGSPASTGRQSCHSQTLHVWYICHYLPTLGWCKRGQWVGIYDRHGSCRVKHPTSICPPDLTGSISLDFSVRNGVVCPFTAVALSGEDLRVWSAEPWKYRRGVGEAREGDVGCGRLSNEGDQEDSFGKSIPAKNYIERN